MVYCTSFIDGRVLVDTCGDSKCSGKPCYNASCETCLGRERGLCILPRDVTQWLGSNTVPREDLKSLNICPLLPLLLFLYTYLSCSTNTLGVLLCSTRFTVLSGAGFLYLAVHWQGTIVYTFIYTYMAPVIYRVIFQLAFGVALVHRADVRKKI